MKTRQGLKLIAAVLAVGCAMATQQAGAALNADEAAKLGIEGTPLTPMGAVRAGNADGSIPAWNPKLVAPPAGYKAGDYPDPYANEKPLFTITAKNYTQYQEKLLPGQIAMFKQYPETFRMHVYSTRRTGVYEPWVYEQTMKQAKNVKTCPDQVSKGHVCVKDYIKGGGIPFPIPENGDEAAWNGFYAFRGAWAQVTINGGLVDALGNRTDVISAERYLWPWWFKEKDIPKNPWFTAFGLASFCDAQEVLQPPRSAGLMFGGCNYTDNFDFQVYLYLPGQRRVRKAPEIGFHDSPSFGSDGQRTVASRYMQYFGGSEARHDRKLVGKKELFVPYNNNKLSQDSVKFDQIFGKKHINQDLIRYELHRVWVVDATLKPGQRHLYKRHVAYLDEDTWEGLAFEAYDNSDRLWRVGEQYLMYFYEPKFVSIYGDSQIDLLNGRYTTYGYWYRQAAKAVGYPAPRISSDSSNIPFNVEIFTPQGLRNMGTR
ncbi:MAG: DUF1329 domain-containing protein [Rhodocyclales bacterium]|nr:DUF1329 domain-containing protein [Rhodocyclales bacterium]